MTMTKRERNKIYKNAYNVIDNQLYGFICPALNGFCKDYQTELPEFIIAMPSNWDFHFSLFGVCSDEWLTAKEENFYSSNKQHKKNLRLTILAFCIAMTEN